MQGIFQGNMVKDLPTWVLVAIGKDVIWTLAGHEMINYSSDELLPIIASGIYFGETRKHKNITSKTHLRNVSKCRPFISKFIALNIA